jgi:hypothetical protein
VVKGERTLHIRARDQRTIASAEIGGKPVLDIPPAATEVSLKMTFNRDDRVPFEVRWA